MHKRYRYIGDNERSKKRLMIDENIIEIHNQEDVLIKWKDIKHIEFQDEDEFYMCREEGFYSENNSWDPYMYGRIIRQRPETDEEYEERMESLKFESEQRKKSRYESYLRLKEEFEPKEKNE